MSHSNAAKVVLSLVYLSVLTRTSECWGQGVTNPNQIRSREDVLLDLQNSGIFDIEDREDHFGLSVSLRRRPRGIFIPEVGVLISHPPETVEVSGQVLARLSGLKDVVRLDVSHSTLNNNSAMYIAKLSNLWELDVSHTQLTDQGLQQLRPLRHLTTLRASGNAISEADVRFFNQLTTLDISRTKASNEIWLPTTLTSLIISGTRVNDEGLRLIVEQCPRLEFLDVRSTHLTDKSVDTLLGMKQLSTVRVARSRISVEALERIEQSHLVVEDLKEATRAASGLDSFGKEKSCLELLR